MDFGGDPFAVTSYFGVSALVEKLFIIEISEPNGDMMSLAVVCYL